MWNNFIRNNSWGPCFFLIFFLLFFASPSCAAVAAESTSSRTIKVVTDNNYPPYVFLDNNGTLQGILVDQWRLWQKKTGISVTIEGMDWGRALKAMKAGEFDVIDTTFKTPERLTWLDFSKPHARIEVPIFFNNEIKGITDVDSLKGFIVAVKEGDAALELLRRHGIENLVFFQEYEAIIQAAKEHKVNVFVIDKPPALYFLYKYGIQQQYNQSTPLNVGEFHRAVAKGNTLLLQEIQAGFDQISDQELQQIEKKWYGSPLLNPNSPQVRFFLVSAGVLCLLILGLTLWNRMLSKAVQKRTHELELREEDLRESESRYRSIIENIQDTFYRTDVHGNLIFISASGAKLLGYDSPEELIGRHSSSFWLHPEKRQEMLDILRRDGVARDYEVVLVYSDGTPLAVSTTTSFYLDRTGQELGVEGIIRDITQRKQAEQALRINEERMRLFFERQIVGMAITSPQKGWLQVNEKLCQMLGYAREDLFDHTWAELTHPDDLDADLGQFNQLISGEIDEYSMEKRFIRKDGSVIHTKLSVGCVRCPDHSVDYILALMADITERKQAEKALLTERQHLIDIIDFLPDPTLVIDTEHRIVAWNRAAEALTGASRETLLGQGNYAYAIPFYGERRPILIDLLNLSDKEREKSYSHIRRSGEKIYAETFIQALNGGRGAYLWGVAAPLYDSANNRTGAIEVIKDITELKHTENEKILLQEQLLQSQKMESIGRLAGGVAHDFNNMLGVILGYTELAQIQLHPSQPLFKNLEEIRKAAQRSADITQQLLAFARKQTVAPKVLDLNETVEGMLNMLHRLIGEDVQLDWLPKADLWPVCVDPTQVDQMLANLCLNARGAITDIGAITIDTGNCSLDAAYSNEHPEVAPGEYVWLRVRDNGCGMDQETLSHIFEPFFTTKGLGKGTGLGLSTVYGAVKQNNGFVQVESTPGAGTTFTIYLPRFTSQEAGPVTIDTEEEPLGQGYETVLLVEDEPGLLEMFMMMLDSQGYRVLSAHSPSEAIHLAREHAGEIHLLMTDVIMPEMNGRDLADTLLACHPKLKTLFMSGYTADVIAHHGVLEAGVCFLQKPFTTQQMVLKIREALESQPDTTAL